MSSVPPPSPNPDNALNKSICGLIADTPGADLEPQPPLKKAKSSFANCPICTEVDTRYLQCMVGHTICEECFSKLPILASVYYNMPGMKCPTCRGQFNNPPTRNLLLESYVQDKENGLIRLCGNTGCTFEGTRKQIMTHSLSCQRIPCPLCLDQTLVKQNYLDLHIEHEHKDCLRYKTLNKESEFKHRQYFKDDLMAFTRSTVYVTDFDGHKFYQCLQVNQAKEEICIWVFTTSKDRYSARINIHDGPGSVSFIGDVFSCDVPLETIFESDECLCLPVKLLKKMVRPRTDENPVAPSFSQVMCMNIIITNNN